MVGANQDQDKVIGKDKDKPSDSPKGPGAMKGENSDNRFKSDALEQIANAAQGIDVIEYMKNTSDGQHDMYKQVAMSIRMQYFTTRQAIGLAFVFAFIAMMISAAIFVATSTYSYDWSFQFQRRMLMFFIGLFISSWITQMETKGHTVCNPDLKEVIEAGTAGRMCIDALDCTKSKHIHRELCTHPARFGIRGTIRSLLFYGSLISIIGSAIAARNTVSEPLHDFIGISFGLGVGALANIVVS